MTNHYVVRDYDLEESLVGVYDEIWASTDALRDHIRQWRNHKPVIQLWDGDDYTNEWLLEDGELIESDLR